jgi:DNA-binding PadR family transcriptional regulator
MHTSRRTFAPPLSPQTFYLLLALCEKSARYGYALKQQVAEDSASSVVLTDSTLYSALSRLTQQRLIEESPAQLPTRETPPGKARRYYRITALGRTCLHQERQRLERATIISRQKLLGPAAWQATWQMNPASWRAKDVKWD